jgi:hypothetical protein
MNRLNNAITLLIGTLFLEEKYQGVALYTHRVHKQANQTNACQLGLISSKGGAKINHHASTNGELATA